MSNNAAAVTTTLIVLWRVLVDYTAAATTAEALL